MRASARGVEGDTTAGTGGVKSDVLPEIAPFVSRVISDGSSENLRRDVEIQFAEVADVTQTFVTKMNKITADTDPKLKDLQASVDLLKKRTASLQGEIDALEVELGEQQTEVATLKTQVATLTADNVVLKQDLASVTTTVTEQVTALEDLTARVVKLEEGGTPGP